MKVEDVINEWDPIRLLSHAPKDEYHTEIDAVIKALRECADADRLAYEIKSIFIKSFGSTFVRTQRECLDIAYQLLSMNREKETRD